MRYRLLLRELNQGIWPLFLIRVKKKDFYMASIWLLGIKVIWIDKSCDKLSSKACRAILLHEIAHLKGIKGEREADMFVINQGHAYDLLSFHEEHNKKYKKYKKGEGLTTKEIYSLIK